MSLPNSSVNLPALFLLAVINLTYLHMARFVLRCTTALCLSYFYICPVPFHLKYSLQELLTGDSQWKMSWFGPAHAVHTSQTFKQ